MENLCYFLETNFSDLCELFLYISIAGFIIYLPFRNHWGKIFSFSNSMVFYACLAIPVICMMSAYQSVKPVTMGERYRSYTDNRCMRYCRPHQSAYLLGQVQQYTGSHIPAIDVCLLHRRFMPPHFISLSGHIFSQSRRLLLIKIQMQLKTRYTRRI